MSTKQSRLASNAAALCLHGLALALAIWFAVYQSQSAVASFLESAKLDMLASAVDRGDAVFAALAACAWLTVMAFSVWVHLIGQDEDWLIASWGIALWIGIGWCFVLFGPLVLMVPFAWVRSFTGADESVVTWAAALVLVVAALAIGRFLYPVIPAFIQRMRSTGGS